MELSPRQGERRGKPRVEKTVGVAAFWRALGPGIVSGAADDDPSGIATYSIAGAQFGLGFLWTALLTWPLMAAVQSMCARVGMVTGRGLMSVFRQRFPRPFLVVAAAALFVANAINVGSDLAAMADVGEMLTTVSSHVWVVAFAAVIGWATVQLHYRTIANTLKWLALVLFAYVAAAFVVHPPWTAVAHATVVPLIPAQPAAWSMLVAILGTTISPYLFFWQTSQEVEVEKSMGRRRIADREGATAAEIIIRKVDVGIGTFVSNIAMYFIILTTALTLHAHGLTNLTTSREVASALGPLAGHFSSTLYALGILGTGALAIPTLAGSAAYALAETFDWRQGIDSRLKQAPAFYAALLSALGMGVLIDFANVNVVAALYWTAVINGVLAPFLLVGLLLVATDRRLMHDQPSSRLGTATVFVSMLVMFGAAVGMFVFR